MPSEIHLIREDVPADYPYSIVPFRTEMVATHPADNPVIRVESIEITGPCPDEWRQSMVSFATPAY